MLQWWSSGALVDGEWGSMIDEGRLRTILEQYWDDFSGMTPLVFYGRDEAGSRYSSGDFSFGMPLIGGGFLASYIYRRHITKETATQSLKFYLREFLVLGTTFRLL